MSQIYPNFIKIQMKRLALLAAIFPEGEDELPWDTFWTRIDPQSSYLRLKPLFKYLLQPGDKRLSVTREELYWFSEYFSADRMLEELAELDAMNVFWLGATTGMLETTLGTSKNLGKFVLRTSGRHYAAAKKKGFKKAKGTYFILTVSLRKGEFQACNWVNHIYIRPQEDGITLFLKKDIKYPIATVPTHSLAEAFDELSTRDMLGWQSKELLNYWAVFNLSRPAGACMVDQAVVFEELRNISVSRDVSELIMSFL